MSESVEAEAVRERRICAGVRAVDGGYIVDVCDPLSGSREVTAQTFGEVVKLLYAETDAARVGDVVTVTVTRVRDHQQNQCEECAERDARRAAMTTEPIQGEG